MWTDFGDGVVDNWTGASLLPSLLYSLSAQPRRHTFVFVGFSAEEKGLVGSAYYAEHLTPERRVRIEGVVNLDSLGLGPTEVWATHADKTLLDALASVAAASKLPATAMNVDKVGSADSESFAPYHIPRITLHSVTQETWPRPALGAGQAGRDQDEGVLRQLSPDCRVSGVFGWGVGESGRDESVEVVEGARAPAGCPPHPAKSGRAGGPAGSRRYFKARAVK